MEIKLTSCFETCCIVLYLIGVDTKPAFFARLLIMFFGAQLWKRFMGLQIYDRNYLDKK